MSITTFQCLHSLTEFTDLLLRTNIIIMCIIFKMIISIFVSLTTLQFPYHLQHLHWPIIYIKTLHVRLKLTSWNWQLQCIWLNCNFYIRWKKQLYGEIVQKNKQNKHDKINDMSQTGESHYVCIDSLEELEIVA